MTAKVLHLRDYEPTRREPYRDTAEFEVGSPALVILPGEFRFVPKGTNTAPPIKDDDPPPRRKRRPF